MTEQVVSSKAVFEGRILKLRVDTVRTVDGRTSTREVVEHAPCIAVIPVDSRGNILLVKQYREAIGKDLLELPAGGIDPGETPEEAVIREMQEETGFLPRKVVRLTGFYSTPGFSNEYLHLFLAEDLVPGRLHAEDTPGIELVAMTVTELAEAAASGKIEDAKTFAGLYCYLEYRKKGVRENSKVKSQISKPHLKS